MIGTAVPRTAATPPIIVGGVGTLSYRRWPYYCSALGLGLHDDLFSRGRGYGYSGYAVGSPYGYATVPFDAPGSTGGLRLKVEPKDAEVYVDGYYAGVVDDFDGRFQRLRLVPGPHQVEVRLPGYWPLRVDVNIEAHHTTEYRGVMYRAMP